MNPETLAYIRYCGSTILGMIRLFKAQNEIAWSIAQRDHLRIGLRTLKDYHAVEFLNNETGGLVARKLQVAINTCGNRGYHSRDECVRQLQRLRKNILSLRNQ